MSISTTLPGSCVQEISVVILPPELANIYSRKQSLPTELFLLKLMGLSVKRLEGGFAVSHLGKKQMRNYWWDTAYWSEIIYYRG